MSESMSVGTLTVKLKADGSELKTALDSSKSIAEKSMKAIENSTDRAGKEMEQLEKETRRANKAFEDTDKGSRSLTSSLQKKALAVAALYVSWQTLSRVVKGSVTIMADYEESLSGVRAVTKATDEQMVKLSSTARILGANTRYSASQAAEGMRFLGMAGFDTNEIIAAMPGMLDLATAGQLDLASAADIASNILSGFNMHAAEAGRVADVLAAAASSSNTNVFQLGDAMKYVAPIAAGLGIDVETTAAAIGTLSNAGLQGSMAGTGLRQILSKLSNVTNQAERSLDKYGLKAKDVSLATNSLTDVMNRLATAGVSVEDMLVIAGDRGGIALSAMVQLTRQFGEMDVEMHKANGTASEMASVMGDNLKGDFLELKSAVEELVLQMGDSGLTKILRSATQEATKLFRAIQPNDLQENINLLARIEAGVVFDPRYSTGSLRESIERQIMGASADEIVEVVNETQSKIEGTRDKIAAGNIELEEMNPFSTKAQNIKKGIQKAEIYAAELERINKDLTVRLAKMWREDAEKKIKLDKDAEEQRKATDAAREAEEKASRKQSLESLEKFLDSDVERVNRAYEEMQEQLYEYTDAESTERETLEKKLQAWHENELKRIQEKEEKYSDYRKGIEREIEQLDERNRRIVEGIDLTDRYFQEQQKRVGAITSNTTTGDNAALNEGGNILGTLGGLINQGFGDQSEMSGIDSQIATVNENFDEQLNLQAELFMRGEIQQEEYFSKIESLTEKHNARVEDLSKKRAEVVEFQQEAMTAAVVGAGADILMSMSRMAKEGSAAQKAFFVASRILAIAQAVINTEVAATQALTMGPILGIPASTAIRALGYASVGLIAAQTVASFEGGGMTPSGPRIGGLDGRGGMLSILHPNEKVTDMTKTGNSSESKNQLNVVVHNYGKDQVEVRQNREDMLEIFIGTERYIADNLARGSGPVSRTMESPIGYNLRRGRQ